MLTRIWAMSLVLVALPALTLAEDHDKGKPFNDTDFVKKAASGGMCEVEAGKIAQDRATSPDVKKFAEKMVTDHSKANRELAKVAEGMHITLDKTMMKHHQKMCDDLKAMSGAAFDKKYIDMMVDDHKTAVAEFKKASEHAKDAKLKDFATKTLPTLEMHDKMARDIQSKMTK